MATKTTNYNLTKPAYDEDADIAVINANMDIIDAKMKEIENAGGSGGGGGASAWSDITGKPFESIGSGLSVSSGVLSATGGGSGSFEILQKEISGNTGETGVLLTGLFDTECVVLGVSCVSASTKIYSGASHNIAVQLFDINNNIKKNTDITITIFYIKISN